MKILKNTLESRIPKKNRSIISKQFKSSRADCIVSWQCTAFPKRISKRGSVLKVRGGCYNYRFKLYKRLNMATKTVVANLSW